MLWTLFFQPILADDLCSSIDFNVQHTIEVLQIYLEEKDCESMIRKLSKTKSMSLVGKDVENIAILANAKQLEYINLADNRIHDLSSLTEMQNVKWLDLSGNPIGSMEGLPSASLESFWCVGCQIHSLNSGVQFTHLRSLSLRKNEIQNLDSIGDYPSLEALLLSGNLITDPLILSERMGITVVELHGNPIEQDKCPRTKKTVKAKGLRTACSSLFPKE